jgi:hypothetical protein
LRNRLVHEDCAILSQRWFVSISHIGGVIDAFCADRNHHRPSKCAAAADAAQRPWSQFEVLLADSSQ